MKSVSRKLMAGVALMVSAAACGDLGDKDKAPEDAREGARNLIAGINIVGSEWEGPCAETELFDKSVRVNYDFGVDNVKKSWVVYDDANCADDIASLTLHGEYKLQREDRDDYRKIDFTFNAATAEADGRLGTEFLESIKFCGEENWPDDEDINLTEASSREGCPLPDLPRTEYDLLKIDGNKMFLGSTGLGAPTEEGERPNNVNDDTAYAKDDD